MSRTVLAFFCISCVVLSAFAAVPQWPEKYFLEAAFKLPYAGIREPIRVFHDGTNSRELIEYYDGLDAFLYRYDESMSYSLFAAKDHKECAAKSGSGTLVSILPDVSTWEYKGTAQLKDVTCDHFQLVKKNGDKVNTYDFYSLEGKNIPIEYHMLGYDVVFGSHYDEYVLEYGLFVPDLAPAEVFDVPALCKKPRAQRSTASIRRGIAQLQAMFPRPSGNDEFDAFMTKFGKSCDSQEECAKRRSNFERSKRLVEEHNAQNKGFTLEINRFADLSSDEFRAMFLNNAPSKGPNNAHWTHRPSAHGFASLPTEVDWVKKGAVTPIKDQGMCGSCWTFSTTGVLEGSLFLKTGRLVSLSEQCIMDCAWNYPREAPQNLACDGGLPYGALEWIIDNGGINTEEAYPYRMANDYCHFDHEHVGARVSAYVNVTEGSEKDLMDAVATKGPISVGIDVVDSFIFYSSGVYYDPACKSGMDYMLHSVLVVGYGTENGQDYWLVKNSWSTHWGDNGYVKMARNRDNNCGIATQAVYPVIE